MHKLSLFVVALFVCTFSNVYCQEDAMCHTEIITSHQLLNLSEFTGVWYMNTMSNSDPAQNEVPIFRCMYEKYTPTSDPNQYELIESYGVNGSSIIFEDKYLAVLQTPAKSIFKKYNEAGEYMADDVVLHTDYENWAIAYSCYIKDNIRTEVAAAFTRERIVDERVQNFITSLLIGYGFPPELHHAVRQANCENL